MSRMRCVVPFCRHTTGRFTSGEWICADHWRAVPARLKRLKRLAERRQRAALAGWLWRRCKATAIEAAMGLG